MRTAKTLIRLGGCPGWSNLRWAHSHIVGFVMRWFKWFFDRVCKTNTHTFTGRQHVCKKDRFTCNQNKMAKTHSCSNRIIHGHIYVHPHEIVRQIFAQIVSLRQITNTIYHVYISNNKNKHFSHQRHKTDSRSFSDLPIAHCYCLH